MDHRAELFALVERVLARTLSVAAFEARFHDFYMDEVPESALTRTEHDFIGGICERLDTTVEHPDAGSRRNGWIDRGQFVAWLRAHEAAFRHRDDGTP